MGVGARLANILGRIASTSGTLVIDPETQAGADCCCPCSYCPEQRVLLPASPALGAGVYIRNAMVTLSGVGILPGATCGFMGVDPRYAETNLTLADLNTTFLLKPTGKDLTNHCCIVEYYDPSFYAKIWSPNCAGTATTYTGLHLRMGFCWNTYPDTAAFLNVGFGNPTLPSNELYRAGSPGSADGFALLSACVGASGTSNNVYAFAAGNSALGYSGSAAYTLTTYNR